MCLTNIPIPSREQFHREYAGEITLADFDTDHPNKSRLNRLAHAFRVNADHRQRYFAEKIKKEVSHGA